MRKSDIADPGKVILTVEQLNYLGIELVRKSEPTKPATRPKLDKE